MFKLITSTARRAALYGRTLRHLRWSQIVGQVRVRVQNRLRDPARILASVAGSGWQVRAGAGELDLCDPVPLQSAADLAAGTFVFIGREHTFEGPVDWTAAGLPRLWQYNLQYFDWLWSLLKAESGKQKVEMGEAALLKGESGKGRGKAESGKQKAEIDLAALLKGEIGKGRGKAESGKQKAEIDQAALLKGESGKGRGKAEIGKLKGEIGEAALLKSEIGKLKGESDCWAVARGYVLDWIDRHPPVKGACGWEPYPTSLRLMNWALLFGVRYREEFVADRDFHDAVMASIAKQVRWLELNLETHIQANHLLENLAALACVGSVFYGEEADATLRRVMPLLERELAEQILPDGLHYERSAMYHLRMLWLVEMLGATGGREVGKSKDEGDGGAATDDPRSKTEDGRCAAGVVPGTTDSNLNLSELAERMRGALAMMRHPDGGIAQFNDAVLGVYHDGWPGDPDSGAWALPDAGYYGFRNREGDYLAVDAGAVGPDYQPGHAHADYLSFELSLDGERIITDTGVGTYDAGEMRRFDRSTAAHSTVEVGGESSCEVWGGFRVGRRVVPVVHEWQGGMDSLVLEASHAGYAHLPSKAGHRRRVEWSGDGLRVDDTVSLQARDSVVSRLCFAPGVDVEIKGADSAVIRRADREYTLTWEAGNCDVSLEHHLAHPTFGAALERTVLVMRWTGGAPAVHCKLEIRKSKGS